MIFEFNQVLPSPPASPYPKHGYFTKELRSCYQNYFCHHCPPIKTPCRTTNHLSWGPVADLVGNSPTHHLWWEVSAPKNWNPFTGITDFKENVGKSTRGKSPSDWECERFPFPGLLFTEVTAGPQNPSSSRAPSVAFPHSKDFCRQEMFNSHYSSQEPQWISWKSCGIWFVVYT